jgi:DNA-binding MarR family transcriptional regulator
MADDPRWLDEQEARAWRAYLDLQRELSAVLGRQLERDAGISGAEYALLVPLAAAPDGALRPRDIGSEVDWDRSRISHQVSRLEKRGLVAREECAEDARGSMVRLTPAGRAAIEAAAPKHVEAVRTLFFDRISADELGTLTTVFERLLAGIPGSRTGVRP